MAGTEEEKSLLLHPIAFGKEAWAELKKVHSPTRQETLQVTVGVLFMVFLFGIFLGLADLVIGKIMQSILT